MAISSVAWACPMKRAIRLATELACAMRSGTWVKGSLPCWRRNITSMGLLLGMLKVPPRNPIDSSTAERRQTRRPWPGLKAQPEQFLPRAFGVVGIAEQVQIGVVHHTFLNQPFEVDDVRPVRSPHQHDRNAAHF